MPDKNSTENPSFSCIEYELFCSIIITLSPPHLKRQISLGLNNMLAVQWLGGNYYPSKSGILNFIIK